MWLGFYIFVQYPTALFRESVTIQVSRYQKKYSPTHTHEEEEGFAQRTRSTAWELIPFIVLSASKGFAFIIITIFPTQRNSAHSSDLVVCLHARHRVHVHEELAA